MSDVAKIYYYRGPWSEVGCNAVTIGIAMVIMNLAMGG